MIPSPAGGWGSCIAAVVVVWLSLNFGGLGALLLLAWLGEKRRDSDASPAVFAEEFEPEVEPPRRTWATEMGLRKPRF